MSQRQFTDAWGDRWDAVQEDTGADRPVIRFRHQSGRQAEATTDVPLDAMKTSDLLELLETVRQQAGIERSVLHGVDAKVDPEGYVNPESSEPLRS